MCGAEVRDNTQVAYLCAIIASVFATIFVLLRLFVVFTPGGKNPGWDDAMIVVCLGLALVPGALSGYRECLFDI